MVKKVNVPPLSVLIEQITPENTYPETPMGRDRGKELLAVLETLEPLDEAFPGIEDSLPEPVDC